MKKSSSVERVIIFLLVYEQAQQMGEALSSLKQGKKANMI